MKNLLSLTSLNRQEITQILDVATQMRRVVLTSYKKGPQLIGHVVAGLWQKPCTSSTAFTLATSYLSGTACPIFGADDVQSQCISLENMGVNTVVVAHENDNLVKNFANVARCNVINGGSGQYDPIGVLADLMTLSTKLDGLQNLSVLVVGNRDNNKIMELKHCLQLFGSGLVWYLPVDDFVTPRRGIILDKPEAGFSGADAVIDIGLTAFSDPAKYYGTQGGIDEKLMNRARIEAPLLGTRNVVDNVGIKEYQYNAVGTRESCYVAVAMAVLYIMTRD
jgi:hypothetical protein